MSSIEPEDYVILFLEYFKRNHTNEDLIHNIFILILKVHFYWLPGLIQAWSLDHYICSLNSLRLLFPYLDMQSFPWLFTRAPLFCLFFLLMCFSFITVTRAAYLLLFFLFLLNSKPVRFELALIPCFIYTNLIFSHSYPVYVGSRKWLNLH